MKNLKNGFTPLKFTKIKIIIRGRSVKQLKNKPKSKVGKILAGFTLMEVIIYLSLLIIIFGAIAVILFTVLEGSKKDQDRIILQTEGDFILAKINWALDDATTTVISTQPPKLVINKSGYFLNPIVFDTSGGRIEIKEGNLPAQYLNSSLTTVSNISIQSITGSSSSLQGIVLDFSLLTTPKVRQSFHLMKHLPN